MMRFSSREIYDCEMPSRSATSFCVFSGRPEAQAHDTPLPLRQPRKGLAQQLLLGVLLHGPHDDVAVRPEHVGQQQLVAVPVRVDRLVERDLGLLACDLADVHEDLILDAARGIGRQLDVPVRFECADGLDEADGPDGDQVLDVHAGVLEPARDVDHEPQIALDEPGPRGLVARGGLLQEGLLLLRGKRRRENVAAADVHELCGLPQEALQPVREKFKHRISLLSGPRSRRRPKRASGRRRRGRFFARFFRCGPPRTAGRAAGRCPFRRRGRG